MLVAGLTIAELVSVASTGMKVGAEAYKIGKALAADGIEVPGLEEYEQRTQEIKDLPDLADVKDGE